MKMAHYHTCKKCRRKFMCGWNKCKGPYYCASCKISLTLDNTLDEIEQGGRYNKVFEKEVKLLLLKRKKDEGV